MKKINKVIKKYFYEKNNELNNIIKKYFFKINYIII